MDDFKEEWQIFVHYGIIGSLDFPPTWAELDAQERLLVPQSRLQTVKNAIISKKRIIRFVLYTLYSFIVIYMFGILWAGVLLIPMSIIGAMIEVIIERLSKR